VRLVDLPPTGADWIMSVIGAWAPSWRWSTRGRTISPDILRALVTDMVLRQSVVLADGGRVAVLQLVESHSGLVEIGVLADGGRLAEMRPAVEEFVEAGFADLGVHKMFVTSLRDELDVDTLLGPRARPAGCLAGHERRDEDVYVDLLLYDVMRDGAR
jgi:hypothetical protein